MTIEICQPELKNLIQQRIKSGGFRSAEDFLTSALIPGQWTGAAKSSDEPTGAGLVAAMQACPVKDIDIEPARYPMLVRGVTC